MKSKVWVLNTIPVGLPSIKDFTMKEETVPECQDGDIIIEAEYYSVDPYIRFVISEGQVNKPVTGSQVARVVSSRNPEYPVGSYVVGYPGWRDRTHLTPKDINNIELLAPFMKMPDTGKHSMSAALGVLGMPGVTAYFGFLEVCKPKPGDIVLVSGAAGAVGSIVCQIAKIQGCTVIAFAGSEKKLKWLRELGVDYTFNYKTTSVDEGLKKAAPNGFNCYFDNVGGDFTADAMKHVTFGARVAICGSISTYNEDPAMKRKGEINTMGLLLHRVKVEGIFVRHYLPRWEEALRMLKFWLDEGRLKYVESTTVGFENLPSAFLGLFRGDNIGKAIVKA